MTAQPSPSGGARDRGATPSACRIGTDDLRRRAGGRGCPVDGVPGLLPAGPGEGRDRRARPGGGGPPRLPHQPAGAGAVDRAQLDGCAGDPGCDQPRLLRHHPRGGGCGCRGRLHPGAGRLPGVGPAGARGDRPGGACGRGAGPGRLAHVRTRRSGRRPSSVPWWSSTGPSPTSRAWSPTTRGACAALRSTGRAGSRHDRLRGRAGGVVGRRDAVAVAAGGRASSSSCGCAASAPTRRPSPVAWRLSTTCAGTRPPRSSPTTTWWRSA